MVKIVVIGHARHGKDTVAEHLAKECKLSYRGSSDICAAWIFEILKDDHGYESAAACFNDRGTYRALWHKLIAAYTANDKARLGRLVFKDNDIYCGIRAKDELEAVIKEFNPMVFWVDASNRHPLEPKNSMQLSYDPDRFEYIDNNGTLKELLAQL